MPRGKVNAVMNRAAYKPKYEASRALVIGINSYKSAAPLSYACHDAIAVSTQLKTSFGFSEDQVVLLLDEQATGAAIRESFHRFTGDGIHSDDRIVFFFAGHGYTRAGHRGEIGYLLPHDGDVEALDTLIRWDELTRNADLVAAKHILFLMDACYGGLAVTRALQPGSSRFLKDMLVRFSRQVLTAGKADEVVADSGGPVPQHSVFTGHLLQALGGAAASSDGIISANAVMAYVYDRVAKDPHSQQSPHYGHVDGDGDFIFRAPNLDSLTVNTEIDTDVLIHIPSVSSPPGQPSEEDSFTSRIKEYLSDSRHRIRLDDLISAEIRSALYETRDELFPLQTATVGIEEFAERIRSYERALDRLSTVVILVSRWSGEDGDGLLSKVMARLADRIEIRGGMTLWLALRWYPLTLITYYGGIGALAAQNYRRLAALFTTPIQDPRTGSAARDVIVPTVDGLSDVLDAFKRLPGHERQFVPHSEYLFKTLQPKLDDLLFLGNGYEFLFDRFEVLRALAYADVGYQGKGSIWGPPGRFAWKQRNRLSNSPLNDLVTEAERQGAEWPLLRSGLFAGSEDRFKQLASDYRDLINQFSWH